MQSSLQLTGIGLRTPHISYFLEKKPAVAWVEVHSENYFADGGKTLSQLEKVRENYPISLHGVNMSIGSADELNWQHLQKLRELSKRINPCLISDHLAWTSIDGQYLHDLMPIPYTYEALNHVVERIKQIQHYLERQILIENISSYIQHTCSEMTEWEFLVEIAKQSNCGILLDINNIYVTAINLSFDALNYLKYVPANLIQEIHLGGFATSEINGKQVLIDSHDHPIVPAVWELYKQAVRLFGAKPTIIEWDSNLPTLEALYLEAYRAEKIMRENYAAFKHTA